MNMVTMQVPEALVAYVEFQKDWAVTKQTGALEMNFFQGGITNMNLKQSLKLPGALKSDWRSTDSTSRRASL